MKITRKNLLRLIKESINNFDSDTGKPLNAKVLNTYYNRDRESFQEFQKTIAQNSSTIGEFVKSKYGEDISNVITQALMAYVFEFDETNDNERFAIYSLSQGAQAKPLPKKELEKTNIDKPEDDDQNARLQQMIDMIDDPEQAEFFRKQMR